MFGMKWDDKRKSAFTLAETLITLMVIGVVAALTIPALM
ncbi:MAG: type II secretion system GspH family protein [bacterium]|nr:type II secretion system GspH family protein [bacterium]